MARKSWNEKLNIDKQPYVEVLNPQFSSRLKASTMLIPTPLEVDEAMKQVAAGKLTTTDLIRKRLAAKHGADIACPMTTGIFVNIAAHAAEERRENGRPLDTPYWRTLKAGGSLNEKYPGGLERQKALLLEEGYRIEAKGKAYVVVDYQDYLD